MSEFNIKRNPLYAAAAAALRELLAKEGEAAVSRVFADVVSEQRRAAYAQKYGLKPSGGHTCIQRLMGKQCDGAVGSTCSPPGADHSTLWLKDGKPFSYVTQPYDLSHETLRALVEFCDRNRLTATISTWPSWHFPSSVVTVEIRPKSNSGFATMR